jgi:coenzyme F420-reducing hydrogenase beta subunit
VDLYAGHAAEGNFRADGSSGGIATWLLTKMADEGLIDGVIHVKAGGPDGVLFSYQVSRSPAGIRAGAKSRYYPVELSRALAQVRATPGRYALVATPLILFEARLLARFDPLFAQRLVYMIGLICGHHKTTRFADALAWQAGIEPGQLTSIDFRKKTEHGLAYQYLTELTGQIDGHEVTITRPQNEFLVSDWGHGFFKAKSSDYTDDALNITSDLTIGDAWTPPYTRDPRGTNILIARHPHLARLLEMGCASDQLHLDRVTEDQVLTTHAGLIRHTAELGYRLRLLDQSLHRPSGSLKPPASPHQRRGSPQGPLPWPIYRLSVHPLATGHQSGVQPQQLPLTRRLIQRIRLRISQDSHHWFLKATTKNSWSTFERHALTWIRYYKLAQHLDRSKQALAKVVALLRHGQLPAAIATRIRKSDRANP